MPDASLSPLAQKALPAAQRLSQSDEAQLYAELGLRLKSMEQDPALAGQFDADLLHDSVAMGPLDALGPFGRRLFKRLTREAHGYLCGSGEDEVADRNKMAAVLGLGTAEVTAAVAALLVSSFGAAPLLATVVAALIIKRFLGPTWEEVCGAWGDSLADDDE